MTITKRVAHFLVLAMCLAACDGSATEPPIEDTPPTSDDPNDEPEPSTEPTLAFSSSYEAAAAGETQTVFDLLATEQIVATFSAPVADGVQVVRIDLYVPSGAIYQSYWQAFAANPELAGTEVPHPHHDITLRVAGADVSAGRARFYILIPVAAGIISKNLLTGTFRQEIFFAGETEPAAAGEFEVVMP